MVIEVNHLPIVVSDGVARRRFVSHCSRARKQLVIACRKKRNVSISSNKLPHRLNAVRRAKKVVAIQDFITLPRGNPTFLINDTVVRDRRETCVLRQGCVLGVYPRKSRSSNGDALKLLRHLYHHKCSFIRKTVSVYCYCIRQRSRSHGKLLGC